MRMDKIRIEISNTNTLKSTSNELMLNDTTSVNKIFEYLDIKINSTYFSTGYKNYFMSIIKIVHLYKTVKAYDKSENSRQTLELCLSLACITYRNREGKGCKTYLNRKSGKEENLESENVYDQGFLKL